MKTRNIIAAAIMLATLISCDTYYHVNSTISKDGSMSREIYAKADSSDMANRRWSNVYLFDTEGWVIEIMDSAAKYSTYDGNEYSLNIKAYRNYGKVNGKLVSASNDVPFLENILAPKETVKKKFGWFYTYYTYEALYTQIKPNLPVPIDKYLTEEEQKIWFDDWDKSPENMNGAEIYIRMADIQEKFTRWINNCQFAISLNIIAELDSTVCQKQYSKLIKEEGELLFKSIPHLLPNKDDYSTESVCKAFDKYFKTDCFSKLYEENNDKIDKYEESEYKIFDIALYHQKHTMNMPGKVYSSNVTIADSNKAEWNIDAYRLLNNDKTVILKSKTINYWAFIVTFAILLIPAILIKGKKNKDR